MDSQPPVQSRRQGAQPDKLQFWEVETAPQPCPVLCMLRLRASAASACLVRWPRHKTNAKHCMGVLRCVTVQERSMVAKTANERPITCHSRLNLLNKGYGDWHACQYRHVTGGRMLGLPM